MSMFVPSVNDTYHPGLQGSLLHDTIADNITSVDWATVSAIRLHVDCGSVNPSMSFNAWGEIHDPNYDEKEEGYPVQSVVPSINGTIGNDTSPGPDSIMVSIDLPILPNEWSAQWSEGGPEMLHIHGRYAGSPYGPGPSANFSTTDDLAWSSRSPPGERFLNI